MQPLPEKMILTDESMRPVAVQISYRDWLEIERRLGLITTRKARDLSRHAGKIPLPEDPDAFQERLRGEWS